MHGGNTPMGVDHGAYKTGRWTDHLPSRLQERARQAEQDPDPLNLRAEITLIDTRIGDILKHSDQGDGGPAWPKLKRLVADLDAARTRNSAAALRKVTEEIARTITEGESENHAWIEIGLQVDRRRKLVESERKRMLDEHQMMSAERVMVLVGGLLAIVRDTCSIPEERMKIATRFDRYLASTEQIEAEFHIR